MMISKKITLILVLIAMVLVPCSFAAVNDPAAVEALEKMPAANAKLEQELDATLVKAGSGAIKEICDLIVTPGTGDDTKARYALASLSIYTSRPDADGERKMYTSVLTDALTKATDKEVQSFFITQLQLVVREETVPVYVLSGFLGDDRLCEPASMALLTIDTDGAEKAFLKALRTANQKNLPTIIHALGQTQSKTAVGPITKHASSKNPTIRRVSQRALANIGDGSSEKILAKALDTEDVYEKSLATSNYLLFAERLSQTGDTRKSAKICRKLIKAKYPASQSNVPSAALSVLVDALGDKAIDDLVDAVDSDDEQFQSAALVLAGKIQGPKATAEWTKKLRKVSADRKVKIIEMLGGRNDKTAVKALRDVLKGADKQVTLAALDAIVQLDGVAALGDLMNVLKDASDEQISAVTSILKQFPTEAVAAAIVKALPQSSAKGQLALLEILAQRRAKQLPAALKNASTDQKISIIKRLLAIGGTLGLEIVADETKSSDPKIQDAAIRSLARWKEAEAMDALLEIASTTKETGYHVITLKGYLGLVTKSKDTPAAMVANFEKAMSIARRSDEKKLVLFWLGKVKSVEALEFAAGLLDDKDLTKDAGIAIAKIALPADDGGKGLTSPGVGGLLLDAYPSINDAGIRKKIDLHVKNISKSTGDNLALNKPVSISCNVQSSHLPKFAVDGKTSNRDISYWGDKWPSWFQVDLQKVSSIESANIWFYWDGRYYQYTIEVSTDGKKFTQVVDQSENTTAATADGVVHKFNAINARYVRVNILKNSSNEAVHLVELEVYAKSTDSVAAVIPPKGPEGFVTLFNGNDLTGWKGLLARPNDNPAKRAKLDFQEYAKQQADADALMNKHWHVVDGVLYFDGGGHSLATIRDYGDFEMLVDWKLMHDNGDSGLYLRGSPQVQIWDPAHHNQIGSGGLYNNKKNPSGPSEVADNPIGQWNTFRIKMIGEKVTVYLNDKLIVDNITMENYWDRSQPIFPREQIELQCHGNPVCFKNIFIREIPRPDEVVPLFNGRDLTGWVGDTKGYLVEDGNIVCKPGGNLYTEKEYSDFTLRFEFKLTPGANNGLGIRAPLGGDAAYQGMELQILDNSAEKWKNLKPYQYHGSIYGVVPAKRGFQKPVGQWNSQEVIAKGDQIKVVLNGETIIDANIADASKDGTMDGRQHPGLKRKSGHIGFLGHGDVVEFRNISIKE